MTPEQREFLRSIKVTPKMQGAGWRVLAERKRVAEVYRLGPGGGVPEIFAAMIEALCQEGETQ